MMIRYGKKRAAKAHEVWPYCATRKQPMQPERSQSGHLFPGRLSIRFWMHRLMWVRARPFIVFGVLMLPIVSAGCGHRPVTPSLPEKRFGTVTVACPGEPAGTVVHRYGQVWA